MKRLLSANLYRIFRSKKYILIFLFLIAFSFFIGLYAVTDIGDIMDNIELIGLDRIKISYDASGETVEEVIQAIVFNQFVKIMWDNSPTTWISFILGAIFICPGFSERTIGLELCNGYSRKQVFGAKILTFYMLSIIIILLPMLVLVFGWCPGLVSNYPLSYILRCTAVSLLLRLAIVSISALVAFLSRKPIIAVTVTFAIALIPVLMSRIVNAEWMSVLLSSIHPTYCLVVDELWSPSTNALLIVKAVAISVIYISGTTALSYLSFRDRDLV